MFARAATQRSMTVKLKTMKTSDMDLTGEESQDYLQHMTEQNDKGPETNQTVVSKQQKLKFWLHWTILIASHIFVFYYIPYVGNAMLYGPEDGPSCDDNNDLLFKYGCRNFHSSGYLIAFYTLICMYLWISAK